MQTLINLAVAAYMAVVVFLFIVYMLHLWSPKVVVVFLRPDLRALWVGTEWTVNTFAYEVRIGVLPLIHFNVTIKRDL